MRLKCGFKTAFEIKCKGYISEKLNEDPEHEFRAIVHSQGATRLNNVSKLLEDWQCKRISVEAYGPATIISDERFKQAKNYVSGLDLVPCTSGWSYAKNVCGIDSNVTFLKPATINPLKEHHLMNETYWQQVKEQGLEFKAKYLNE
jgi:hypothetical protein